MTFTPSAPAAIPTSRSRVATTSRTCSSPRSAGARYGSTRRSATATTSRELSCSPRWQLVGLRISELCALDGEDLDFAGRRIYVPRLRKDRDGQLVRVQGIKTEAAERVVPMLPALYDLLIDHKAEFGYGAHDPVFATRNGRRNTVDNVRRTIVDASVERANELLAARGQREIARCTPHTLRRTFASVLAELNLPPRRAMYLIGHTDPTLTMRVYQQVIDMGEGGLETLEKLIGCTLDEAFALLSGRGVLATNWQPAKKNASQPGEWSELEGTETPLAAGRSSKRLKGLEPSTFCMASRRSSELSYSRARPAV